MIPGTSQRVPMNTSEAINQQIREEMLQRVAQYHDASLSEINSRLAELEREWDVERTLEANASSLAFTGCVLALTVNRRWIALPMAVTAFLFQHAVQGWCPPLPVLRRLGVRTMREIDDERMALKAIRGDFVKIQSTTSPRGSADAAVAMAER